MIVNPLNQNSAENILQKSNLQCIINNIALKCNDKKVGNLTNLFISSEFLIKMNESKAVWI